MFVRREGGIRKGLKKRGGKGGAPCMYKRRAWWQRGEPHWEVSPKDDERLHLPGKKIRKDKCSVFRYNSLCLPAFQS